MKHLLLVAFTIVTFACTTAPSSAAVEYIKICTLFGAKYFYVPGTDTCLNADTGVTITPAVDANGHAILDGNGDPTFTRSISTSQKGIVSAQSTAENALAAAQKAQLDASRALEGVAMSLAMQPAVVTPGHTFGASVNVGTFSGQLAIGISGAVALNDNLTFNGAIGAGLMQGSLGGRAGFNLSW